MLMLSEMKQTLDNHLVCASAAREKNTKYKADLELLKVKQAELDECNDIMNTVNLLGYDYIQAVFERLTTQALQAVFGTDYTFKMVQEITRGKASIKFNVVKAGVPYELDEELGGGVSDVVAFALRIVVHHLSPKETGTVFLLDEIGKFVSKEYQDSLGAMIQVMGETLGLQFILISHEEALIAVADRAFEVTQTDKVSHVRMLE